MQDWLRRHPLRLKLLLAAYWLSMFVGTHVPSLPGGVGKNHRDKLLHFGAYFGLTILLAAVRSLRGTFGPREYLTTGLLVSGYGAVDEILQQFVGRHCDPYDWLADTAGALVALLVWAWFSGHLPATRQERQ